MSSQARRGAQPGEDVVFSRDFGAVLESEREAIEDQRAKRGIPDTQPVWGVALSGGGIRSASFALGVLQALHRKGYFPRVDYLSTVSGGGFIGTALTWFQRWTNGRFPFPRGDEPGGGDRTPGRSPEDFLRWHANYLDERVPPSHQTGWTPGSVSGSSSFSLFSLLSVVGQMMVVTLLVYGGLLVVGFFIVHSLDGTLRGLKAVLALLLDIPPSTPWLRETNFLMVIGLFLGLLYLGLSLASSLVKFLVQRVRIGRRDPTRLSLLSFLLYLALGPFVYVYKRLRGDLEAPAAQPEADYAVRMKTQRWADALLRSALLTILVGTVPLVAAGVEQFIDGRWIRGGLYGMLASSGALFGFVQQQRQARGGSPLVRLFGSGLFLRLVAALTLYTLLLTAHSIAYGIIMGGSVWVIWALLVVVLFVGLMSDLNALGSHRMYRDRLMETFLPDKAAVEGGFWQPAFAATSFRLSDAMTEHGPYHLLNASLSTQHSTIAKYHSRGADSFVLSPLFSGSEATGWRNTATWPAGGMTVPTAMAVSAAAVNPGAALGGSGPTRGWALSTLMALLNLRLGYWASNPDPAHAPGRFSHPYPTLIRFGRFLRPYLALLSPPLGNELREDRRYVELADGGVFDSMGIYELVRRRTDVIVLSDATVDERCSFDALGIVWERIRIDFEVGLTFPSIEHELGPLRPALAAENADDLPFSQRAHAVGEILYPATDTEPAKVGILLLVKAVVTENAPLDILAYRAANPLFPNEPTVNQFFDERQFEAYRTLGLVSGLDALDDPFVRKRIGDPVDAPSKEPPETTVASSPV